MVWTNAYRNIAITLGVVALAAVIWRLNPPYGTLPDFSAYDDIPSMKQAFRGYLTPIIRAQNTAVLAERAEVEALAAALNAGDPPGFFARRHLRSLGDKYGVEHDPEDTPALIDALLERIDAVPEALVLAQAAKESGWGRSRFAQEGNNLFGQWCYEPGCGIVPDGRGSGQRHEVATFRSPFAAVGGYLRNLNSHPSYEDFRDRRQQLRRQGSPLDPLVLAEGLLFYSERREAYVEEVKAMVRQFQRLARQAEQVAAGTSE